MLIIRVMNRVNRSIDLYIFHGLEDVIFSFFEGEKLLKWKNVNKKQIGEKWVESFEICMKKLGIGLEDIEAIYLNSSFSTWNASRLITIFVKTLTTYRNINFYIREESQDKLDPNVALKSFYKDKKNFKSVQEPESIVPLYKKCPNINI
ncbi:hypothetical protein [Candidatus Mycoplasma haematohominis]|uniref:Uncharacterized protein n=1 Tax=Candidatus Mycoplasma haematohominis TaxID=1494318 RepID=A0A478FQD4_9MOLU|nr:hypothetical protein [Candidatus Mycoplasma haemohominis]GCE63297.1 hypothetical protein MHSWG343_02860 [Candidatus Mycoplasma haemohominis]